jgi:hypothetical protein
MNQFARTYWFTWGFLLLAALFTGVSNLQQAFFGGVFAALFSTLATRGYVKLGLRFGPFLGAALGVVWAIFMLYYVRWTGSAEDYLLAQWNLGTSISIHAAGFAGAGLFSSLANRLTLGKSAFAGAALATAMTAIPYGVIDWVDYHCAGPMEVVLLVSPDVAANEAPPRLPGAEPAELTDAELQALKNRLLVVSGPGGNEVIDEQGRRYWPLWRKKLVYPGNPKGPVRHLVILLPPDIKEAQSWTLPVTDDPKGIAFSILEAEGKSSSIVTKPSLAIRTIFSVNARPDLGQMQLKEASLRVTRQSPIGNFYNPDPLKSELYLYFPKLADKKAQDKEELILKSKTLPVVELPEEK